jgi:hypothetical protein
VEVLELISLEAAGTLEFQSRNSPSPRCFNECDKYKCVRRGKNFKTHPISPVDLTRKLKTKLEERRATVAAFVVISGGHRRRFTMGLVRF